MLKLPRRAISINKDKKSNRKMGLGHPHRRISTIDSNIFDLPIKLKDGKTVFFSLDTNQKKKKIPTNTYTKNNEFDDEIKLNQIDITFSSDSKIHNNQLPDNIQKKLRTNFKKAKAIFENNNKVRKAKQKLGMSTLLQKCNDISIEYYKKIQKEFKDFENKYFIKNDQKYNIYNFRINNESTIITQTDDAWNNLHKNIPDNKETLDSYLKKEFKQMAVDTARLSAHYTNGNELLLVDNDDFNNSRSRFEISQMILFFVYKIFTSKKIIYDKLQSSFSTKTFEEDTINSINQKIIQKFNDNTDLQTIKKDIKNHIKKTIDFKPLSIYQQDFLLSFSTIYLSTFDVEQNKFNLIDSIVLYTYIYIEKKLYDFFILTRVNKKERIKNNLLTLSIINLIDPNLFSQQIELIQAKDKNYYEKKYTNNKNQFLKSRIKKSFTYNRGESLINNPASFQSANNQAWFLSENLKYNLTSDKPFSVQEMYETFDKIDKNKLNQHHKLFLEEYKKMQNDNNNNVPYFQKRREWNDKDINTQFSNKDNISDVHDIIVNRFFMYTKMYGINMLLDNKHKNYHYLHDYLIDLHKNSHVSWLFYNIIHLKNIRTSLHYSASSKKFDILEFKNIIEYYKKSDAKLPDLQNIMDLNNYRMSKIPIYVDSIFTNEGLYYEAAYDKRIKSKFIHKIDFMNNYYINPLTTTFKETYVKHYNYFIERIQQKNGSIDNFLKNFKKLFHKNLILYKNGLLPDKDIDDIKKTNKGITIVNGFKDLWTTFKNDTRINVKENKIQDIKLIDQYKGWIDDYTSNSVDNSIEGIYHVDYTDFLIKVSEINNPKSDFFTVGDNRFKKQETNKLWPQYSGRPFIFINKKYQEDSNNIEIIKNTTDIKKILENTKGMFGSSLPTYWFNYSYLLNEDVVTKEKEADKKETNKNIKSIKEKLLEQKKQVENTSENIDQLNKQLDETKTSDDEIKTDDEPVPVLTKKEEILKNYGLKIENIKPDGDCLFEAFRRFLKTNKKEDPDIASLRKKIVEVITNEWDFFKNFIIGQKEEGIELYEDKDDYVKKMTATKPDPTAPRARFGDEPEITAFERLYNYKVQVLKWNPEQETMEEIRNFDKDKINDPNTLTLYNTGSKHYDYLRPIIQKGGSFYINKCKNHRHKKTRKFRLKLKLDGDWLHITKPKKKTRRKY